jgi:hypothetical protein
MGNTNVACRYGTIVVAGAQTGGTRTVCLAPAASGVGTVSVQVSRNNVDWSSGLTYEYGTMGSTSSRT